MPKSHLIKPHGADNIKILLPEELERKEYAKKAETLPQIPMTSREASDLIMLGIGAFTPLDGFMGHEDWRNVCTDMMTTDKLFWPIPITLSAKKEIADGIKVNSEAALIDPLTGTAMGIIRVSGKYAIDKSFECRNVFGTEDPEHPGVEKVMSQGEINISGRVVVLHESIYPDEFRGIYQRPAESRRIFEEKGWETIAALQLRNPMHRSHEFLAKVAIEVSDGLYIHQLLGELKQGDIPADVRVRCINTLVDKYFVKDTVVTGGYPMEMRYAGPREALLHAIFRQNYGCTHLIVGRDHAGVGDYYGPFDAQKIFHQIPENAILTKSLPIDWTFYCYKCQGMASMKTCPHGKEDRLFLSGTALRKGLSEGGEIPEYFSRPEVLDILKEYYRSLTEKVEIKTHKYAEGDTSGINKN